MNIEKIKAAALAIKERKWPSDNYAFTTNEVLELITQLEETKYDLAQADSILIKIGGLLYGVDYSGDFSEGVRVLKGGLEAAEEIAKRQSSSLYPLQDELESLREQVAQQAALTTELDWRCIEQYQLREQVAQQAAHEAKLREQEPFTYVYRYHSPYGGGETELSFTRCTSEAIEAIPLYLHPAPSAPEWQPIETAPKDGTRVLIKGDCTVVAGWQEITGMFGLMGWAIVNDSWMPSDEARYWMPLPKPLMAAARSDRELQHEHTMKQFQEVCNGRNCYSSKARPAHSEECKADHDACYAAARSE